MTDQHMVTMEHHGADTVVTILDDAGRDADVEIHFKERGPTVTLRQHHPDTNGGDVIVITVLQAEYLRQVLDHMLTDEDETVN
jgi:hypothetical protein